LVSVISLSLITVSTLAVKFGNIEAVIGAVKLALSVPIKNCALIFSCVKVPSGFKPL